MNLTDLVTSRDLSEKLAKAGVEQDSLFWWTFEKSDPFNQPRATGPWPLGPAIEKFDPQIAAFTTDELLEKLQGHDWVLCDTRINPGMTWPGHYEAVISGESPAFYADRPVEALGLLLLKLSEGKVGA